MNMKKNVAKTLVVAAVAGALMVPAAAADAAENAITVTVDNKAVAWEDATPFIQDNRTLVPLRAAAEAMGLEVDWDGAAKCASFSASYKPTQKWMDEIKKDEPQAFLTQTTVKMYANQDTYEAVNVWTTYDANGNTVDVKEEVLPLEMDSAVVMKDNRTYAPIRYVAEPFGYEVSWAEDTRTVQIVEEVDASWLGGLFYDEANKQVVLATGNLNNVTSIAVKSASIQKADAEAEALTLEQMSAEDAKAFQATQEELKPIEKDLTAYAAPVTVEAEQVYDVTVTLEVVKSNGVAEQAVLTLQIDTAAAEETAN